MRIIWVVPRQQTSARVAYAQIDTLGGDVPLEGLSEALRASLVSGTRVARYDRTWRLGPVSYSGDNAHGRIGFQSAGAVAEIWDDTQGDFVSIHPPAGQTTPYAIDMRTMRMVFQLRGQTIRPNTFRGNFQGLLREASHHKWLIRLEGIHQPPWEEWLTQIDRLIELRITMKRPNPRYPGKLLEDYLEGAKLAASTIVAKAREGESIDIESSEFLRLALQLAEAYGSYKAVGVVESEGEPTIKKPWSSALEGLAETVVVDQDPETREVRTETLDRALEADQDAPAEAPRQSDG